MTLKTLDLNTALIVVDLQKAILGRQTAHPIADVVKAAAALAETFRARSLPVVLVNVVGRAPGRTDTPSQMGELPPDFAEILPELDTQPDDILVSKRSWGAFTGTGLERILRDRAITEVVVCGVATATGVESTARQAHELGFNVALALDAMSDTSAEAHEHTATHIFPKLGETGTAREIIRVLGGART